MLLLCDGGHWSHKYMSILETQYGLQSRHEQKLIAYVLEMTFAPFYQKVGHRFHYISLIFIATPRIYRLQHKYGISRLMISYHVMYHSYQIRYSYIFHHINRDMSYYTYRNIYHMSYIIHQLSHIICHNNIRCHIWYIYMTCHISLMMWHVLCIYLIYHVASGRYYKQCIAYHIKYSIHHIIFLFYHAIYLDLRFSDPLISTDLHCSHLCLGCFGMFRAKWRGWQEMIGGKKASRSNGWCRLEGQVMAQLTSNHWRWWTKPGQISCLLLAHEQLTSKIVLMT